MKVVFGVFLLLYSVVGNLSFAGEPQNASEILSQAKEKFKQAISLEGGWTSTDKLLKQAEAALKKGDKQKAVKLALKAKREAELSYRQAADQKDHWSEPPYIRQ
jgi:hypothetical protein